jgi:hypothetical protein
MHTRSGSTAAALIALVLIVGGPPLRTRRFLGSTFLSSRARPSKA